MSVLPRERQEYYRERLRRLDAQTAAFTTIDAHVALDRWREAGRAIFDEWRAEAAEYASLKNGAA